MKSRAITYRSILLILAATTAWNPTFLFGSEGIILDVSLPIVGKSSHAIARALERSAQELRQAPKAVQTDGKATDPGPLPTIVLQFRVGSNQETFGRGSSFGSCYELADLLVGENFTGIRTVAYFPQSVRGHAVLVALACNERMIAEDADFGEAGIDETEISATQREAYFEISKRRSRVPRAVVEKLLDSKAVLQQVETEKGIRLASPEEIEELRKTETFAGEPKTLIPAGQPGIFSADMARKINLVDRIADDRVALARSLGFRPDDMKSAPIADEAGHAVRIDLNGPINNDNTGAVIRSIRAILEPDSAPIPTRAIANKKIDFICLYIDSPGGNIEASLNLASFLAGNVDSQEIRTVAYIPYKARSDAALIALACDEIVLGPNAVLGGDGAVVFSQAQIADARRTIRDFLAREATRSWSLPVGFVDPGIEVFKMTRQGRPPLVDYFCDEETAELPDAALWNKGEIVKRKGVLFEVVGGEGEQYLVDRSAKDFAEFKFLYGLENDPLLVEPGWADRLLRMLSSPEASATILLIVFLAVFVEAKTPGIGIGAFVAVLGIVLFFWLNFLGGTAGWLEILLFLAGVIFVLLEIFVLPGIGIFGIGGAITIIASLVLASQTFIIPQNSYQFSQFRNSLFILAVSGAGVLVLGAALSRFLNQINRPKDTEFIRQTEKLADYDPLLGRKGVATTPLVPAGKALFEGELVNVVSDGELVDKGAPVEVVEVVGYRVVVRKI